MGSGKDRVLVRRLEMGPGSDPARTTHPEGGTACSAPPEVRVTYATDDGIGEGPRARPASGDGTGVRPGTDNPSRRGNSMLSSTHRRSLATLGVVAGLLAAAVPATAATPAGSYPGQPN